MIPSSLLVNSVSVQRPAAATPDASGVPSQTFIAVADLQGLPASVQFRAARVIFTFGQRHVLEMGKVYLSGVVDVRRGDRLVDELGATMAVVGVYDMAGRGVGTAVDVEALL